MTTRVLRIGVIQDGRVVEDRILGTRETVTVGRSEKSDFVVHDASVGDRFELFVVHRNDTFLRFGDDTAGRISIGGETVELGALRERGGAERGGDGRWLVRLSDDSRGKIDLGAATLLFQFVVPPPVRPMPRLPMAVRGGADVDWLWASFVGLSVMLHFGVVVWTQSQDFPVDTWQGIPDVFADFVLGELPRPQPIEEGREPSPDDGPTQEAERTPPRRERGSADPETVARRNAERHARLEDEMGRVGVNGIIGSLRQGEGELADVLAGGRVDDDLDEILSQVHGVGVEADRSPSLGTPSGGGPGDVIGLDRIRTGGGDEEVATGVAVVARVRAIAWTSGGTPVGGGGVLDPAAVVRVIRGRMAGIKMCYERRLRHDPTLAGRVSIQFTITGAGTVTGAHATEDGLRDSAVASCVAQTIGRMRFPSPEDGAVSFSFPFVFEHGE